MELVLLSKYVLHYYYTADGDGKVTVMEDGVEKVPPISLAYILVFATGAAETPPMGFDECPSIVFNGMKVIYFQRVPAPMYCTFQPHIGVQVCFCYFMCCTVRICCDICDMRGSVLYLLSG